MRGAAGSRPSKKAFRVSERRPSALYRIPYRSHVRFGSESANFAKLGRSLRAKRWAGRRSTRHVRKLLRHEAWEQRSSYWSEATTPSQARLVDSVRLERQQSLRDLALFDLAIDSKLRASDLVRIKITDVCSDGRVRERGVIVQKKTRRPVQFEITRDTRTAIEAWICVRNCRGGVYLFPSRQHSETHISVRQYARIVHRWIRAVGLDSAAYGTHSMRRTKAAQIYKKTGNLRAVQLLLGHTKLESTVRYLGIEVDDAIAIAEQSSCELP